MKRPAIYAAATALMALPLAASAQNNQNKSDGAGRSEFAPGQQQGPAKDAAPGQRMHKNNDPTKPGASEYAPGQQDRTNTQRK